MSPLSLIVLILFFFNSVMNAALGNWPAVIGWAMATLCQFEKIVKEGGKA